MTAAAQHDTQHLVNSKGVALLTLKLQGAQQIQCALASCVDEAVTVRC